MIVFNASKGAFAPTADNAAYASSKAAVAALARNLATELGPAGIRVNYFNADFVDTPLMRGLIAQRAAQRGITPEQQIEEYRQRNAMNVGPIPAGAVAEAALFLASARVALHDRRRAADRRRRQGGDAAVAVDAANGAARSVRQPRDQRPRLLRPRRRRFRLQGDVPLQMRARLRSAAQPLQRHRQVEVRVGEVGRDLQHAAKLGDRQLQVAFVQDQVRQVEARLRLIGVQRQRGLEALLARATDRRGDRR